MTGPDFWLSLRETHPRAIFGRRAAGVTHSVPAPNRLTAVPGDRIRAFDGTGHMVNLTIVGILEQSLQFTSGVFVDINVTRTVFPAQEQYTAYFFQVAPGVDVSALRSRLEQVYFDYGLQTIDIREQIGQAFDATQEVLTLMEAYLGIGLLVGIAGLAVVTLRAVVERRTQIGALRAIGFTQGMVLRMFLLEIALIAVLGVGIGMSVAAGVFGLFALGFGLAAARAGASGAVLSRPRHALAHEAVDLAEVEDEREAVDERLGGQGAQIARGRGGPVGWHGSPDPGGGSPAPAPAGGWPGVTRRG